MFNFFVISLACAQDFSGQNIQSGISGLLTGPLPMLLLMFVIFYFVLIRPQQKKAKAHKEMLASLHKGDEVITSGGIYGKITGLTDQIVVVEVTPQVRIKVARGHISGIAVVATKTAVVSKRNN